MKMSPRASPRAGPSSSGTRSRSDTRCRWRRGRVARYRATSLARGDARFAHRSVLAVGNKDDVRIHNDGCHRAPPTDGVAAASVRATMSPISSPKKLSGQLVMSPVFV